ncbi:hypothetical protein CYY_003925 [Polysphondylium violaceum]|uniref:ERCC4 domain-containing protein n=1 Tax=Polysphondylium violaceum TaxID=133409 RepID=A0A8J4PXR7_9MYCE|nr:hypothetical protein CYY_003925 [Polysphondylium violaceum]
MSIKYNQDTDSDTESISSSDTDKNRDSDMLVEFEVSLKRSDPIKTTDQDFYKKLKLIEQDNLQLMMSFPRDNLPVLPRPFYIREVSLPIPMRLDLMETSSPTQQSPNTPRLSIVPTTQSSSQQIQSQKSITSPPSPPSVGRNKNNSGGNSSNLSTTKQLPEPLGRDRLNSSFEQQFSTPTSSPPTPSSSQTAQEVPLQLSSPTLSPSKAATTTPTKTSTPNKITSSNFVLIPKTPTTPTDPPSKKTPAKPAQSPVKLTPVTGKPVKEYMPQYQSGPFSLLCGMYSIDEPDMTESRIQHAAQQFTGIDTRDEDPNMIFGTLTMLQDLAFKYKLSTMSRQYRKFKITDEGRRYGEICTSFFNIHTQFRELNNIVISTTQPMVTVVVDQCTKSASMERNLKEMGVNCITRKLSGAAGNALFVPTLATPYSDGLDEAHIYPYLIERITLDDFVLCMFEKQVQSMIDILKAFDQIQGRILIVEGSGKNLKKGQAISFDDLKQEMWRLEIEEGIIVIHTISLLESTKIMAYIARILMSEPGVVDNRPLVSFKQLKSAVMADLTSKKIASPATELARNKLYFTFTNDQFKEYILNPDYRKVVADILNSRKDTDKILLIKDINGIKKDIISKGNTNFKKYFLGARDIFTTPDILLVEMLDIEILNFYITQIQISFNISVLLEINTTVTRLLDKNYKLDEEMNALLLDECKEKYKLINAKPIPTQLLLDGPTTTTTTTTTYKDIQIVDLDE